MICAFSGDTKNVFSDGSIPTVCKDANAYDNQVISIKMPLNFSVNFLVHSPQMSYHTPNEV